MLWDARPRLRACAVSLLSTQLSHILPDAADDGAAAVAATPSASATPHLLAIVGRLTPFLVVTAGAAEAAAAAAADASDDTKDAPPVDASTAQAALLAVDVIGRSLAASQPELLSGASSAPSRPRRPRPAVAAAALLLISTLLRACRSRRRPRAAAADARAPRRL